MNSIELDSAKKARTIEHNLPHPIFSSSLSFLPGLVIENVMVGLDCQASKSCSYFTNDKV